MYVTWHVPCCNPRQREEKLKGSLAYGDPFLISKKELRFLLQQRKHCCWNKLRKPELQKDSFFQLYNHNFCLPLIYLFILFILYITITAAPPPIPCISPPSQQDGSLSKGIGGYDWSPKFNPCNSQDRSRELPPASCSLTSTQMLRH